MSQNVWVSCFQAIRPKTLTASLVPILVGTSVAQWVEHQVRFRLSFLALISAILIQIGTNLINDASDFRKGADSPERLGPKRLIQGGIMTANQVWVSGLVCFGLAALFAVPLVQSGGWPIITIGICSLLAGYSYTAGPFPLAYLGLGDLFVVVFYGWVAVMGMYYLNTDKLSLESWVAGSQVGLLAAVMISINNLRDQHVDLRANKKTLAVRFGKMFAKWEITFLCLMPFGIGVYWYFNGVKWAALMPIFLFPISVRLVRLIHETEPSELYNRFLAQGAALHLGFGLLLSLGFLL